MPRLVEKNDGGYIVRHFYQQNATWQIDEAGVALLRKRGILPGQKFSTDLFMELMGSGLVYTKQTPHSHAQPSRTELTWADLALRERVAELYQALSQHNTEDAYEFLYPPLKDSQTVPIFQEKLEGLEEFHLVTWKIQSFRSAHIGEPQLTRTGIVTLDLVLQNNSGIIRRLDGYHDTWVQVGEDWYWVWSGWLPK